MKIIKCDWFSILKPNAAMETCGGRATVQFTLDRAINSIYRCDRHAEEFRQEYKGWRGLTESRLSPLDPDGLLA